MTQITNSPISNLQLPVAKLITRLIILGIAASFPISLLALAIVTCQRPGIPFPALPCNLNEDNPASSIIPWEAPTSFALVGLTFALVFTLAIGLIAIGHLSQRSVRKIGQSQFALTGLIDLACTALASLPVFVMTLFLVWLFGYRWHLLPVSGDFDFTLGLSLNSKLKMLLLPVCALAVLPAGIAVPSILRIIRMSHPISLRVALGEMARLLASFFHRTGEVLSAIILVELIFNRAGIGQTIIAVLYGPYHSWSFSWPAAGPLSEASLSLGFISTAIYFILLVCAGRTLGELFGELAIRWAPEKTDPAYQPVKVKKRALLQLSVCMVLLLLILGVAVVEINLHPMDALRENLDGRFQEHSPVHPLGTDHLGRDIWSRLQTGTAMTFGEASLAAASALLLALPSGLLAGRLLNHPSRREKRFAAFLLLPAEALLCLPSLLLAILVWGLLATIGLHQLDWILTGLLVAFVLLPQTTVKIATLWSTAPDAPSLYRLAVCLGDALISTLFAAFILTSCLDFLGLGVPSPIPTLGGLLLDFLSWISIYRDGAPLSAGVILWIILSLLAWMASSWTELFPSTEIRSLQEE